ncbi:MAG TPA: hypothetical protein VGR78_02655 [Verrucomicrobiae bacterium]|nr:hypothetical protein [Verrucomicrobiae bacterium]
MRSLGRLVRGLSALFWGLPLGLVICVYVATNEWIQPLHMIGPIGATGLLFYGLHLLGDFQKQERIWRDALDRAKLLALINLGFSPFIYWYNRMPFVPFYGMAVFLLMLTGLLFLYNLNHVLQRLAAMLPDETLRSETRVFGNLNIFLLAAIFLIFAFFFLLRQFHELPGFILNLLRIMEAMRYWLLVFLILLPLAMTMTLIWKIKEVIFASVFSHGHE